MNDPRQTVPRRTSLLAAGGDLLASLAVVAALWITVVPVDDPGRAVQLGLAGITVAAVLLRRRWPVTALAVSALATSAAWVLGLTADPFLLVGGCAFVVAEHRGRTRLPWWLGAAGALVLLSTMMLGVDGIEDRLRGMLLSVVVLVASWVLGVRTRQARVESAAVSRAEERLRISRDIHDVLSHSLGVIGVRAGVAAHVSTLGESELRTLLREIESDARESLGQLRQLLDRAREDSAREVPGGDGASLDLAAALAALADTARRTGLQTRVRVDPRSDTLPTAVKTTVYRVAQEALTNTIRHAEATVIDVAVHIEDDEVHVEVFDDGRGAGSAIVEGHGLVGMRERVMIAGGVLRAEPGSPAGFVVTATFPLAGIAETRS